MYRFNSKRIADPVYGTIGLSDLEVQVINTRAFLRLRNVKQLGLAHYVFPGVDYSRFAHSLGCCHVAGRMLESIQRADPSADISDDCLQLYRLAGLLHDIGHYPLSHAVEEATNNFYAGEIVVGPNWKPGKDDEVKIFEHERVGQEVLDEDGELKEVLARAGFESESIWSIFMHKGPQVRFPNLISSDLDADRIDYLLRTAHHSGLPYGTVDLDYLISQMRLDSESNICITTKALRAADHLLLCRYFDYLQVSYHKTVAAFELVLKDVITGLLREELLCCSGDDVTQMIKNGVWHEFDDISLVEKIRRYAREVAKEDDRVRAQSILDRNPARLVYSEEFLDQREGGKRRKPHQLMKSLISQKKGAWASEFGIDSDRWYVWSTVMELTKIGSHEPIGGGDEVKKKAEQAARVRVGEDSLESVPITTVPQSLMNIMSNYANYMLRVYVLLTPEESHKRSSIEKRIREDLEQ
jgi:uncharacterized protein